MTSSTDSFERPANTTVVNWRHRLFAASWLPPVALALLPFVVFWAITLGRDSFFLHDIQYYFYPYHTLVANAIRQGEWPLWNPYAFSGIPLLGDGQTAIFYPPNWLFFVLPTSYALNLVILLQFSIAGVGMWLFGRRLGLNRGPAVLAALSYMFSGFLVTRVVHLSIMSGAALIPLIFWGLERMLQRPGRRNFVVAVLMIALQAVAGHPQLPVYTAFLAGVYVLVRVLTEQPSFGRLMRSLVWLALAYVAAYLLAAIQLAPWIDFARLSPRAANASFGFVTFHSVAAKDWLQWLFPYSLGGVREGLFWRHGLDLGQAINVWERAAYVGILPLVAALIGVSHLVLPRRLAATAVCPPRSRGWALLAVLVVGGLIAAGSHTPFGKLVYWLPVMGKLRAPSRAIVLASFAACALAGWGMHYLQNAHLQLQPVVRRQRLLAAGTIGVVIVLTLLWTFVGNHPADAPWTQLRTNLAVSLVPLLLIVATTLVLPFIHTRGGLAAAVVLVAFDLGLFAVNFNPTTSRAVFDQTPPSVEWLHQDQSRYRTASFISSDVLAPTEAQDQLALSWSMVYGISNINGFNSLQPRRYTDVLFGPEVEDVSYGFLGEQRLVEPDQNLLSLLNVKYVLVQRQSEVKPGTTFEQVYQDQHVTLYRNLRVFGPAFFVNQVEVDKPALAAVREQKINLRTTAVVEGLDASQVGALTGTTSGSVKLISAGMNDLEFAVSTSASRLLVVSEPFFPGWQATLDGQPITIHRADYLLRAVVIPPGSHTLSFHYRPISATIGVTLTALMTLVLGLLAGWPRR